MTLPTVNLGCLSKSLLFAGLLIGITLITLSSLDACWGPESNVTQEKSTTKMNEESLRQSDFRAFEIPSSLNDGDGLEFAFVNANWINDVAILDFQIELDQVPAGTAILSRFACGTSKNGYRFGGKFTLLNEKATGFSTSIKLNMRYEIDGKRYDETYKLILEFERSKPTELWHTKKPNGARCFLVKSN
jgi:hypothetical protein